MTALAVKLNVLSEFFEHLWENPLSQWALGAAFLFGFSERLLDEILSKLEDKTLQNQAPTPQAPPKIPPTPSTVPVSPTMLPDATVGQPYGGALTTTSVVAATWALKVEALPPGLTIRPDGTFVGQPTAEAAGKTYPFTATATGQSSALDIRFGIRVKPSP
jgi:hypothetical protein